MQEYFGTDLQLIWSGIKNELPSLKAALEKIHVTLRLKLLIRFRKKSET